MISESVQDVTGQTDRQTDRGTETEGREKGNRGRETDRPREKQKKTHQFSVPM